MKRSKSNNGRAGWLPVIISALILLLLVSIIGGYRYFVPLRLKKIEQKIQLIKHFSFSNDASLKEWEEKIFKGRVQYKIERSGELSYVRAHAKSDASALYYRIKINAKSRYPVIRWKWRAETFPEKKSPENLELQNEDDFAARFYVIFPALFFTNSKVLEYVWAKDLPVGTIGDSPYSKNIKLIVLRSGQAGQWFEEERDIYADYVKMFGRPPEYDIGAVAFMTNTEHTETDADALYDEIELGYR